MLADRFGPRRLLAWAALSWGLFSVLTGMIGTLASLAGISVWAALIVVRFVLGLCEGPVFPAGTRTVVNWFPLSERAQANGLCLTGISVGSFLMPPIVSWMITSFGWENSFYIAAVSAVVIALAWTQYVRDRPSEHPLITPEELRFIEAGGPVPKSSALNWSAVSLLLGNGNLWRLVLSYALNGYVSYVFVFWFYLYLVQVRHFGRAESAWLTTIPWVLAAISTFGCGYLSDRLILTRLGLDWGRRIVPIVCQVGAAIFLVLGARVANGYLATAMLAVCTGLILGVEGPYWATGNQISSKNVGLVGGLLNTGGNFGGVISPTLSPVIAHHFGWVRAFDFAALVAVGAAVLWFNITPSTEGGMLRRADSAI
jgi:ACS family glucarate transporter-like MFS transporter